MVTASFEPAVGAAQIRAAPDTSETKKATSWKTPRSAGLTGSSSPVGGSPAPPAPGQRPALSAGPTWPRADHPGSGPAAAISPTNRRSRRRPTASTWASSGRPGRRRRGDGVATARPGTGRPRRGTADRRPASPTGRPGAGRGGWRPDGRLRPAVEKVSRCQCTQGTAVSPSPLYSGPVTGSLRPVAGQLAPGRGRSRRWGRWSPRHRGRRPAAGPPGTRRARASLPPPPAPIRARSVASHGWSSSSWTPMGPPITTRPATDR